MDSHPSRDEDLEGVVDDLERAVADEKPDAAVEREEPVAQDPEHEPPD